MNESEQIFRPKLKLFGKQIITVIPGISLVYGLIMIPVLCIPLITGDKLDWGAIQGFLFLYLVFVVFITVTGLYELAVGTRKFWELKEHGIQINKFFGKPLFIEWEEIVGISYQHAMVQIYLDENGNRKKISFIPYNMYQDLAKEWATKKFITNST